MRRIYRSLLCSGALGLAALALPARIPAARAAEPALQTAAAVAQTDLEVGMPAPDFTLPDQDGKLHHLTDLRGKTVVLAFYPKDLTAG